MALLRACMPPACQHAMSAIHAVIAEIDYNNQNMLGMSSLTCEPDVAVGATCRTMQMEIEPPMTAISGLLLRILVPKQ